VLNNTFSRRFSIGAFARGGARRLHSNLDFTRCDGSRWTLLCRCRLRHQTLICWHDAPCFAASWLSKVGRRSTRSFAISVSASWASA
jgi:hypothetical protein